MPTLVQSQQYNPGGATSNTGTITPSPAVTSGNKLYAAVSFFNNVGPVSAPAGWDIVAVIVRNGCGLNIYSRTATGSETSTYVFTTAGTDYMSVIFFEVSSSDTNYPVNKAVTLTGAPTATQLIGSPVPSVIGCLAVAIFATDEGTGSRTGASTVDSGWTLDQSAIPTYHAVEMAHKTAATTDLTTAISVTFTYTGIGTDACGIMLLFAPTIAFQTIKSVSTMAGIQTLIL